MSEFLPKIIASLLAAACAVANAESCQSQGEGALWAEEDFKILGADLAYSSCPSWFSGLRLGLSYYADDEFFYKGVTGAGRIQFGNRLRPFVGLGVLAGSAEREIDGSADGRDNDGNGFIDEPGERKTEYEASAFLYPEVGISYQTEVMGFTLSARQYYGTEFSGNVIFSLGISLPLTERD